MVTGAGDLLVMTQEFQVLSEQPVVPPEPEGEVRPVSLGWGSPATQFQGQAGKLATQAPPLPPATVPHDDGLPRISWRGDGEFFATSSLPSAAGDGICNNRRTLHVWDRAGVLQCMASDTAGLEQALAWRPSGNLIAATQRLPHRHDVVFFERNGLRHGEFTLPCGQGEALVQQLSWNCASTVLAVWLESLPRTDQSRQRLQLWTTGNYHWYAPVEPCYCFVASPGVRPVLSIVGSAARRPPPAGTSSRSSGLAAPSQQMAWRDWWMCCGTRRTLSGLLPASVLKLRLPPRQHPQ